MRARQQASIAATGTVQTEGDTASNDAHHACAYQREAHERRRVVAHSVFEHHPAEHEQDRSYQAENVPELPPEAGR
jgi:hypothetical protein